MMSHWLDRPWTAFLCDDRSRKEGADSICVPTKPMTRLSFDNGRVVATWCRTSSRVAKRLRNIIVIRRSRLVAGSMNERNRGSIVSEEF